MASLFMGRAGTGANAASRALSPMRSTRSSPTLTRKNYGNKHNSSNYRSMGHLRALHAELVGILDESSDTAATDKIKVSGAGGARAAKRDLRLIEILRAISELVRGRNTEILQISQSCHARQAVGKYVPYELYSSTSNKQQGGATIESITRAGQ